jgi:hypothetical protein
MVTGSPSMVAGKALARRNDPAVAGRDERLFSAFGKHWSLASVTPSDTPVPFSVISREGKNGKDL